LAPLKWAGTGTNAIIMSGSEVKLNVPFSSLGPTNYYFVMQIVADGSHMVVILWGITQYGTYSSGIYFGVWVKKAPMLCMGDEFTHHQSYEFSSST